MRVAKITIVSTIETVQAMADDVPLGPMDLTDDDMSEMRNRFAKGTEGRQAKMVDFTVAATVVEV